MKNSIKLVIIAVLIIAIIYVYNDQLAAIPLLILSIYLFILGIKKMRNLKK